MRLLTPVLLLALVSCSDGHSPRDAAEDQDVSEPVLVSASGHAFFFGPPGGRVEGAEVTILELPGLSTTTAEDGAWSFADLTSGTAVSFVMSHPEHTPIQTGTITLPETDIEQVSFQAPSLSIFEYMSDLVGITPDPTRCQVASTVTRRGHSLYDTIPDTHGEPDATVTIDPPLPPEHGPVYFDLITAGMIFPNPDLTETTDDGGVLYTNVPPGTYTLSAHKPDTVFTDVIITCRPGLLVNAAPPWGLQAIEGGIGPRE